MKQLVAVTSLVLILSMYSCSEPAKEKTAPTINTTEATQQIGAMLDSFNRAAATADYNRYFNYYTEDAIFAGTDATERWDKKAFMAWAKPFFDKGKAWDFTALERHIYFSPAGDLAWFDELLNTQMKVCRGSGVAVKQGADWKLKQYILSTTVPNDKLDSVISMKSIIEDGIIKGLQGKK